MNTSVELEELLATKNPAIVGIKRLGYYIYTAMALLAFSLSLYSAVNPVPGSFQTSIFFALLPSVFLFILFSIIYQLNNCRFAQY